MLSRQSSIENRIKVFALSLLFIYFISNKIILKDLNENVGRSQVA